MWVPGRDASVSVEVAQPDAEVAAREELAAELAAMRTQQAEFLRLRTQLERMQVGIHLACSSAACHSRNSSNHSNHHPFLG